MRLDSESVSLAGLGRSYPCDASLFASVLLLFSFKRSDSPGMFSSLLLGLVFAVVLYILL